MSDQGMRTVTSRSERIVGAQSNDWAEFCSNAESETAKFLLNSATSNRSRQVGTGWWLEPNSNVGPREMITSLE